MSANTFGVLPPEPAVETEGTVALLPPPPLPAPAPADDAPVEAPIELFPGALQALPPVVTEDEVLDLGPHTATGDLADRFRSLYVNHRSSVAGTCRKYLRDERDVDEVVQEAFLRMFLALPEIDGEMQALAYARRTATNLCIDRWRQTQRRPQLVELSPEDEDRLADDDPEQADLLVAAEDASVVREALARLTPLQRQALVAYEVEGKSIPTIEAELGQPAGSVKHVLVRARRSLRKLLVGTSVSPDTELTLVEEARIAAARSARAAVATGRVGIVLLLVPMLALLGFFGFRSASRQGGVVASEVPQLNGGEAPCSGLTCPDSAPVPPAAPAATSKPGHLPQHPVTTHVPPVVVTARAHQPAAHPTLPVREVRRPAPAKPAAPARRPAAPLPVGPVVEAPDEPVVGGPLPTPAGTPPLRVVTGGRVMTATAGTAWSAPMTGGGTLHRASLIAMVATATPDAPAVSWDINQQFVLEPDGTTLRSFALSIAAPQGTQGDQAGYALTSATEGA
ncbi:RNA polymerase sigma factor, partial [Oryzihumus sp.]